MSGGEPTLGRGERVAARGRDFVERLAFENVEGEDDALFGGKLVEDRFGAQQEIAHLDIVDEAGVDLGGL